MMEIVEFVKAQMAIDEQLALATTPVPVPGRWKVARDKHADDGAPLALVQGDEVDDPGYEGYSYNHQIIVYGADWQDEIEANLRHIARHDPATVLANVAGRRAILAEVLSWQHAYIDGDSWLSCAQAVSTFDEDGTPGSGCADEKRAGGPCNCGLDRRRATMLNALAAPYAGRPGFKDKWRLA